MMLMDVSVWNDLVKAGGPDLHIRPAVTIASDAEFLALIEHRTLKGSGIAYVHTGLLASLFLTLSASLCTNCARLHGFAKGWGLAANPTSF
jgi:hypothetical protein